MNNNHLDLPCFERELMRPKREEDLELGKEIWFPNWNCFCCHDTGLVNPNLVKLVIKDYNLDRDKLPICQNPGCFANKNYASNTSISSSLDWRFDEELCQKLDLIHRQEWQLEKKRTISQLESKIIDLAQAKSLRRTKRSQLENEMAAQNHDIERAR